MATDASYITQNKTLLALLECQVCLKTCQDKIYMCINGHNLCSTCQLEILECPTCRAPGQPTIRNLALEELATVAVIPCKNAVRGCTVKVHHKDMDKHNLECMYQYQCFIKDCWVAKKADLVSHVKQDHPDSIIIKLKHGVGTLTYIRNMYDAHRWATNIRLCQFENELFWITFSKQDTNYSVNACYIGTEEEASQYNIKFSFISLKLKTVSIKFAAPPLTLTEDENESIKVMAIPIFWVDQITTASGRIKFNIRITRD